MSYMASASRGGLAVLLLVGSAWAQPADDAARDDEQPPLVVKPEPAQKGKAGKPDKKAKPAPPPAAAEPQKPAVEPEPAAAEPPPEKPAPAPEKPAPAPEKPAAAEPAKPPPVAKLDAPQPGKPRLTVYAYEEGTTPEAGAAADAVEAAVAESLRPDPRIAFATTTEMLDPPIESDRALGRADLALVDAESEFSAMELDKAKQLLNDAVAAYNKHLPRLAARGGGTEFLRDAWLKLAKTQFFDGNPDAAREAMRYALVLDPTFTFKKELFPPTMKKMVVEARLLFETLGPGKLSIDSDPPGATVYLNGKKLPNPTPTEAPDASPGPNYVSFELRGYQTVTATVENKGEGQTSTVVQGLPRWPKNPFGHLDRARKDLDAAEPPRSLKEAAQTLGVDLVVLVRTAPGPDENKRTVLAYLYDARPDKMLKRSQTVAPKEEVPQAARALASELLKDVRLDGVWRAPEPPKKPSWWAKFSTKTKSDFVRFYHWKYFWYVVGGAAGAVVLSTAIGVGVAEHNRQTAANSVILFGGN
jgi:hypothetical protein